MGWSNIYLILLNNRGLNKFSFEINKVIKKGEIVFLLFLFKT
nr:MAG TPA: hypothetical protein [Caudoviricetes sp.]